MEQPRPSPIPDSAHSPRTLRREGAGAAIAAAFLLATAAAPVVYAADAADGAVTVSQHRRQFSPNRVVIRRGSVVHIVNDDKVTHHVFIDAPGMSFDSGEQPVGTTVDLHFDKSGTFPVQCAIHPTMRLEITVE
jgi:cytochrome c peroxidase